MKGKTAGTHLASVVVVDNHSQDEGCHGPVLSLQTTHTEGYLESRAGSSHSPLEHYPKNTLCHVKIKKSPAFFPLSWYQPCYTPVSSHPAWPQTSLMGTQLLQREFPKL